ncbi:hypothetical protein X943_000179 [Babesia divergens]|uniref:Uncharacterized protein n=1 Tax=Babesia divergens TaxID=32595 RepID=A0AAD9GC99_BABDI|nr:hypothetical protein X943_000179 [Babesia divergens]
MTDHKDNEETTASTPKHQSQGSEIDPSHAGFVGLEHLSSSSRCRVTRGSNSRSGRRRKANIAAESGEPGLSSEELNCGGSSPATLDSSPCQSHRTASSGKDFDNTLEDPTVDVVNAHNTAEIRSMSGAQNLRSFDNANVMAVSNENGTASKSRATLRDVRANAIQTVLKDPIVPHGETLKRIRASYQLKELSEEDYVGCLETIIERDYFPHLVKLRLTNALLEAETRGDDVTAELIRKRLEAYDQRDEIIVQLSTVDKEKVSLNLGKGGLTLDEFARIFTSEDNRSFARLLEQTIIKKNANSGWMEEGERRHNRALCNIQSKTNLGIKDNNILTNKVVSRNGLFFNQRDPSAPVSGSKAIIRTSNTYMAADHEMRMSELDRKQKKKRTEKVADMHYNKVNELITQFGLRECRELLDEEQKAKYDFVHTPLISSGPSQEYNVPVPATREEVAEKLRKKYSSSSGKTPMAQTPMCRTPLIVQKLIAKHKSGVDMQLRKSYSSSKGSTCRSVK